jgi:hypothetical protein
MIQKNSYLAPEIQNNYLQCTRTTKKHYVLLHASCTCCTIDYSSFGPIGYAQHNHMFFTIVQFIFETGPAVPKNI